MMEADLYQTVKVKKDILKINFDHVNIPLNDVGVDRIPLGKCPRGDIDIYIGGEEKIKYFYIDTVWIDVSNLVGSYIKIFKSRYFEFVSDFNPNYTSDYSKVNLECTVFKIEQSKHIWFDACYNGTILNTNNNQ